MPVSFLHNLHVLVFGLQLNVVTAALNLASISPSKRDILKNSENVRNTLEKCYENATSEALRM